MRCKICGNESKYVFSAKILNKYNVDYFHCPYCNFLQTEEPYWLDEAYQDAINISDTGIMQRNLYLSKITTLIIFFLFNKNAIFLDYAGGYGIFVRLMRDIGYDFYWYDKYSKNLLARSFEYNSQVGGVELITCFEAFEHFVNPIEEIENMLSISKNILFTTELLPNSIPKPNEWWYYGLNHGQHISFYNKKTFKFIGDKYNLNFYTNGRNIHLLTEKSIKTNIFKLVLKLPKIGFFHLIKKQLKSKLNSDSQNIKLYKNVR